MSRPLNLRPYSGLFFFFFPGFQRCCVSPSILNYRLFRFEVRISWAENNNNYAIFLKTREIQISSMTTAAAAEPRTVYSDSIFLVTALHISDLFLQCFPESLQKLLGFHHRVPGKEMSASVCFTSPEVRKSCPVWPSKRTGKWKRDEKPSWGPFLPL